MHAIRTRTLFVAAGAASVLTLTAAGIATASTTIDPAGADVTADSSDIVITTANGYTLQCNDISGEGTIPEAPGNSTPDPGGIDIDIDNVTFTGCTLNSLAPATVKTQPGWYLNANGDNYNPVTDQAEGSLFIPAHGAKITAPGCTISVIDDSTVGPLTYDNPSSSATANNDGVIWYKSSGGPAYCPPATNGTPGTAKLSGTLTFETSPNGNDVRVTD